MNKKIDIAVVGATGLVGRTMIKVLQERNIPIGELIPVASEKSVGKSVEFCGKEYKVISLNDAINRKPHIALFSAGAGVSREWAPIFAKDSTIVIDNSSCWRMDPQIRLIVPEINANLLTTDSFNSVKGRIIANPNCSTIQMVMALYPLHLRYGIKRVVVSTYQSITGTGEKAVRRMAYEREHSFGMEGLNEPRSPYPYPIDLNIIPQIDDFLEDGYTKEERKMIDETRKILSAPEIGVTATTVRVPVMGGHSESVNVEFERDYTLDGVREALRAFPGVAVEDDSLKHHYPMPLYAYGSDLVYVGRIRRDNSAPNALNLWIVSDNLRKGAATNAVQIVEKIIDNQ